jgi:hypothetical protein
MRLSSILRRAPRKSDVSDLRTLNLPISETSEIGGAHLRMRDHIPFVIAGLGSLVSRALRGMQPKARSRASSTRYGAMTRCRPGIVARSELSAIPDQRCNAARCTASGERRLHGIGTSPTSFGTL